MMNYEDTTKRLHDELEILLHNLDYGWECTDFKIVKNINHNPDQYTIDGLEITININLKPNRFFD